VPATRPVANESPSAAWPEVIVHAVATKHIIHLVT
jgi:hypothetical protein